ncbi:acyl carrier protein [Thermobifida cellulosilytica]|uniref:Carrier domain-containing protein n=1 Tax=Thermobifida cellulosilytica TB100 TaxID=665004 RepID=A0A147KH13_THECS|nr:acyl carrier protein [Thermobifida cellulosilytica]KUP96594.1 hypothetical protein AC529_11450 [Thermobifida cellulosilytica TB100]
MPSQNHLPSREEVSAWLAERVARHARLRPQDVEADRPLTDYGLDSVSVFVLCGEFEDRHRVQVEPTSVWEHPTVRTLTDLLMESVAARDTLPSGTSGGDL